MKIVGIITEYNPFHNGHLYQIKQIRKMYPDAIIVVAMSGNFLQRGEPAIVDKWTRAKLALTNGVDIVVEVPVEGCVQPADRFAENCVKTLIEFDCEILFFGAEHANYDFSKYAKLVENLQDDEFRNKDRSYAQAYQEAVTNKIGHKVDSPNDVLGLAYAKANLKYGNKLILQPIQRNSANFHDKLLPKNEKIASATAIRKAIFSNNKIDSYMPVTKEFLSEKFVSWNDFWTYLKYKLISSDMSDLERIYGMAEGIQYRMKRKAIELPTDITFEEWLKEVKSKRFTYTRLTRLSIFVLLNIRNVDVDNYIKNPFARLLGFTEAGQKALNQIKRNCNIKILTKISQDDKDGFYYTNYKAGKIYQSINQHEQDIKRSPLRFYID